MVKVFHTGDIHACARHRTWVTRALTHAVDTSIEEGCELNIIAGDSFDSAISTHEPAFVEYVQQIVRLAQAAPTVVIYGTASHDRPGSLNVLRQIPTRHPLHVVSEPRQIEVWLPGDDLRKVLVSCLPGLNKADPAVMEQGANAWAAQTLASFAPKNIEARAAGIPTLLTTHGTVVGCLTESKFAMVSPDHSLSVESLASADADAVMLAHIHLRQKWPNVRTPSGGLTTIAYPGSLSRLVHGHREPVGFLIWDLEPGQPATLQFHESPSRQLLEIDFPALPDMDELRALAATVTPDDSVRIRWTVDEEHAASVDKALIRELFAGAESVKLEPRVLPVQRVRAEGIGKAMTLFDKLRYWTETADSREAYGRLADRLMLLQGMDVEQIVSRITNTEATKS